MVWAPYAACLPARRRERHLGWLITRPDPNLPFPRLTVRSIVLDKPVWLRQSLDIPDGFACLSLLRFGVDRLTLNIENCCVSHHLPAFLPLRGLVEMLVE